MTEKKVPTKDSKENSDSNLIRNTSLTYTPPQNPIPGNYSDVFKYTVPSKLLTKAEGLMNFLEHNGGQTLKWNDRGELLCNDKKISNSHIADLVKDAVMPHQTHTPIGYECFYKSLAGIHTPQSFIRNTKRRQLMYGEDNASRMIGKGHVVKIKTNGRPPGQRVAAKRNSSKARNKKWIQF